MSPLTRLTNIQLSLIPVNPLSDVPILDTLMSFAYVRRHASFLLASHLAVSSNAVRVRYAVVRFNRVRIELTFYHYSLKRTHNLGLDSGPNFRWQYSSLSVKFSISLAHSLQTNSSPNSSHHRCIASAIASDTSSISPHPPHSSHLLIG